MRYVLSVKANLDIDMIWLYTLENRSLEQADRYYNLFLRKSNIYLRTLKVENPLTI